MSKPDKVVVRFVLSQRIEHILLVLSFGMLCLTGLPQRYIGMGWAQWLLGLFGGVRNARTVHHFFAFMLAAQTLYHAVIIAAELLFVRPRRLSILPRWQDVRDGLISVGYLLGLRKDKPRYGRFDFKQKVEYWAMIWGTLVMGVTGLILLFPVEATRFLSGAFLPAAHVVHSYEALLAFLAIITWHVYNSHLAAGAFPVDAFSIFTGKTTLARMQEEHPLEYEQWVGKDTAGGAQH